MPRPVVTEEIDWAVFAMEVPSGTEIAVDGNEHDRFEWVTVADALRRCRPDALIASFVTACEAMGLS